MWICLAKHQKDFFFQSHDPQEVHLLKCSILMKLETDSEETVKYLITQLGHPNHNTEVKSAILRALSSMKKQTAFPSAELLKLIHSSPEQIVPVLLKNVRDIPKEPFEQKAQLLSQMCVHALAYGEAQAE